MTEPINLIIGGGVVILNLIPIITKKPKLLKLTIVASFLVILAFMFARNMA